MSLHAHGRIDPLPLKARARNRRAFFYEGVRLHPTTYMEMLLWILILGLSG